MFKPILMKLRHALRELPDDLVSLNKTADDLQICLDKMRRDPHGGRSSDCQISYIHRAADRLRRAEIDGKIVFDIPQPEKDAPDANPNPSDNREADDNSCDICGGSCFRCHDCESAHRYAETINSSTAPYEAKKGFRTFQGKELTEGAFDVLDEWHQQHKYPYTTVEAIRRLNSADTLKTKGAREELVITAAYLIKEIERMDKADD